MSSLQLKKQILRACAACIGADGRVTALEGELSRAISDSLGCPMPPLLSQGDPTSPAFASSHLPPAIRWLLLIAAVTICE